MQSLVNIVLTPGLTLKKRTEPTSAGDIKLYRAILDLNVRESESGVPDGFEHDFPDRLELRINEALYNYLDFHRGQLDEENDKESKSTDESDEGPFKKPERPPAYGRITLDLFEGDYAPSEEVDPKASFHIMYTPVIFKEESVLRSGHLQNKHIVKLQYLGSTNEYVTINGKPCRLKPFLEEIELIVTEEIYRKLEKKRQENVPMAGVITVELYHPR